MTAAVITDDWYETLEVTDHWVTVRFTKPDGRQTIARYPIWRDPGPEPEC